MSIFRRQKQRLTSILITFLMSLQMSACTSEDNLAATENSGVDEPNTIILSWITPSEREDKSVLSLSAIAGYKIYYGTTQGQYSDNITINDGTAIEYTFTGLPVGTYYFVVTTVDTEERESQYSSEVTVTI